MTDVSGRWALVTGASRGIGFLAAECLARSGCNLILHSRREEHLDKIVKATTACGVQVRTVAAELSNITDMEDMLRCIDGMGVPVDIVLNNAGMQIAYRREPLLTPASDYEQSFWVNTIAPMMITYHFLPAMVRRGFGRIVNTTSGIRNDPYQAGYSASKAALDKVTVDLAGLYDGTDVMINLTDPGWCRTDLGGPHAPNSPESSLPGVLIGVFLDDKRSGRCFAAPDFHGMTLPQAVAFAQKATSL